jgi:hypothetical protein
MGDRRKLLASEFTKHRRIVIETTRRKRKTAQTGGLWSDDKLPGFTREPVARILFTACSEIQSDKQVNLYPPGAGATWGRFLKWFGGPDERL